MISSRSLFSAGAGALLSLACSDGSEDPNQAVPPEPGVWCGVVEYEYEYASYAPPVTVRAPVVIEVEGRQITSVEHEAPVTYLSGAGAEATPVTCPVMLRSTDAASITANAYSASLSNELGETTLSGTFPTPDTMRGTVAPLTLPGDWAGCGDANVDDLEVPEGAFTATPGPCTADPAGGAGGSGAGGSGAGGEGGGGGGGGTGAERTCGAGPTIDVPSPRLAEPAVLASSGVTNAAGLVDGVYHGTPTPSLGTVSAAAPAWVAIDVGVGPDRLLLAWTDPGWGPYTSVTGGAPADYLLETSADSTDGVDGVWVNVATVTANTVKARSHAFDFTGQRWVRMTVTAPGTEGATVAIDEIELHDVSAAGNELPPDTWVFMGDSIVDGAHDNPRAGTSFTSRLTAEHPAFEPLLINAGIGGEYASHGASHVGDWLEMHPDVAIFTVQYGTNDSWGNKALATTTYEADMRAIVEAVLAAGRTPILARIPFANDGAHETLPEFNAVVDALTVEFNLPCGPDLYDWFQAHPDELSADGVHPSARGYTSISALWAEAVTAFYTDG